MMLGLGAGIDHSLLIIGRYDQLTRAILIDVLVVRMVIAPTVVMLFGDRAWLAARVAGSRLRSRWRAGNRA